MVKLQNFSEADDLETISTAKSLGWFIESLCRCQKVSVNSVFKCMSPVSLTLSEYGERLGLYLRTEASIFVAASIFIKRLFNKLPQYFCPLSAHKLMCSSVLIGLKFFQDKVFGNNFYSETFGVTLSEANRLETVMLSLLDFKLFIDSDSFHIGANRLSRVQVWKQDKEQEQPALEYKINILQPKESMSTHHHHHHSNNNNHHNHNNLLCQDFTQSKSKPIKIKNQETTTTRYGLDEICSYKSLFNSRDYNDFKVAV